jgi:hypothetical protein
MRQRALGTGEVDEGLGVVQTGVQVSADGNPAAQAQGSRRIHANGRTGGHIQGATELAIVGATNGLNQHAAHAAAGTGHTNTVE